MSKTLEQILKIIEEEEKRLRKLDLPIIKVSKGGLYQEVDLNLNKSEGLQKFLLDFFYWNNLYGYESPTYRAKVGIVSGNTIQQKQYPSETPYACHFGARRSVGDLFRIALNYYDKEVTLLEIMKEMYTIVQDTITIKAKSNSNYLNIYMQICSTILRRVFCGNIGSSRGYRFNNSNEYYGRTTNLENEFKIYGEDYNLLFNTVEGKQLVEERLNPALKLDPKDLDKLVMEKLAKLRGSSSTNIKMPTIAKKKYYAEDYFDSNLPF